MASEWRETTLGEVVQLQRGHDLPEPMRRPGKVPIMGSFGITGWHDEPIVNGPGVTVGRSGASIGAVSFVQSEYWPLNTCLYVTDFKGNDPKFCYYWLQTLHLAAYNSGSAQPSLNRNYIYSEPVSIPESKEEQIAIAHVLGTLDDKIELNRKMNEILEAAARALFKSWFVDFDPVCAKAEGRLTGLPPHIDALFPGSFEDSELGEIPRGWEPKTIADLATVQGGSTPSTKEATFWEGGTHFWATPKDLSGLNNPVLLGTERMVTDAGLAQISSGLLPAGTVLLSSRAPIGYLAIAEVPVAVNQGFIAMRPQDGISNLFLLLWAEFAKDAILSRANGSTFLEISKSIFRPLPVVAPTPAVMKAFEKAVRPLYSRIVMNERESRCLSEARDALLPKLISGELRVGNSSRTQRE